LDTDSENTLYLANDYSRDPAEEVVLKLVPTPLDPNTQQRTCFLRIREALELSKLNMSAIARLIDFGDGYIFLVTEYIKGKSLGKLVHRMGPMNEQTLLVIAYEMARALDWMDLHNVMHRNIKPENILVSKAGAIKLTDFNLVYYSQSGATSFMDTISASPEFVSPEEILGEQELDVRSDIFSLGATLYFAATGKMPFMGYTPMEVFKKHFEKPPPPVHEINPSLSMEFSNFITTMMAPKKEDRCTIESMKKTLLNLTTR